MSRLLPVDVFIFLLIVSVIYNLIFWNKEALLSTFTFFFLIQVVESLNDIWDIIFTDF